VVQAEMTFATAPRRGFGLCHEAIIRRVIAATFASAMS
jgi:hypothetical protein